MSDLMRCVLAGLAVGGVLGGPAFWLAPTWVAALLWWLPIIVSFAAAFIRQHRRLWQPPPPGPPHAVLIHEPPKAISIIEGGQRPDWQTASPERLRPIAEILPGCVLPPTFKVTDRIGTLRHYDGTVVQCHGYPKTSPFGPHPDDGKRWWQTVVHNPRHPYTVSNGEIDTWPVIFEGTDD